MISGSSPERGWPTALRGLLVVAHVLAALAMFSLRMTVTRQPSDTLIAVWLGFAGGQIFAASAWAILRPVRWPWRLATVVVPTLAWIWNNGRARDGEYEVWLAFFLPLAISAAACATAMRMVNGCRLVSGEELAGMSVAPHRQFSLRTLMLLTAVAAVACTALEVLARPWLRFGNQMLPLLAATLLSGSVMLLAWFRVDRYGVQRTVSCLAAVAAGSTLRLLESPIDLGQSFLLSSIECAVLAFTYQTWRVSGLRLSAAPALYP